MERSKRRYGEFAAFRDVSSSSELRPLNPYAWSPGFDQSFNAQLFESSLTPIDPGAWKGYVEGQLSRMGLERIPPSETMYGTTELGSGRKCWGHYHGRCY